MAGEVTRYSNCLLRHYPQFGGSGYTNWEHDRVFRGYQRGHGLGKFLRAVGKIALPVVKTMGKKFLKSALSVGSDVLAGENLKSSIKRRGKQTIKSILTDESQEGAGFTKSKRKKRKSNSLQLWTPSKRIRRL